MISITPLKHKNGRKSQYYEVVGNDLIVLNLDIFNLLSLPTNSLSNVYIISDNFMDDTYYILCVLLYMLLVITISRIRGIVDFHFE